MGWWEEGMAETATPTSDPRGSMPELGLTAATGTTRGLRGELGGENAQWAIHPKTQKEEAVINGYFFSDLMKRFGSLDALRNYGANPNAMTNGDNYDPYVNQGVFAQSLDLFNARPSNDTFSGKDGLADLASIAMMFGTAYMGGAWDGGASAGAGAGSTGATAGGGTASMFGPGTAETLDASLIGPASGAAEGSGSLFAPGGAGMSDPMFQTNTFGGSPLDLESFSNFGSFDPGGDFGLQSFQEGGLGNDFGSFDPGGSFEAAGPQGSSFNLEDIWKKIQAWKGRGVLGVASGLYGLYNANQMKQLSQQAMQRSDPFGPERAGYATRLRELYADPSSVERLPGFKAGLTAVERKMASQGYNGSGNMMLALKDYGEGAFNTEANRLAVLSGAAMRPDNTSLQARISGNDLTARSLASLAYGLNAL